MLRACDGVIIRSFAGHLHCRDEGELLH